MDIYSDAVPKAIQVDAKCIVPWKIFHNGMKNICLYLEADQRALITGHHGPAHAPARAEDVAAAELVPQLGRLEDQSEVSIAMKLTNQRSVLP